MKSINVSAVKNEDGTFNIEIKSTDLSLDDARGLLYGLSGYAGDAEIPYDAPIIPELEEPGFMDMLNKRIADLDSGAAPTLSLEEVLGTLRGIPELAGKKIEIHPDFLDDLNKINKKPSN